MAKITLVSSTGESFEVDEAVAFKSITIRNIFGDGTDATLIPIRNVTGPILARVIEYCERHVNEPDEYCDDMELIHWDEHFVQGLDKATLFDLVVAADYLGIQGLLNLTCDRIAQSIKGFHFASQVRSYYRNRDE